MFHLMPTLLLLLAPEPGDLAPLRQLADWMVGTFSSQQQAKEDPAYFDVRLHVVRIWPERQGEHWLYVEQAMATALDKPYRQRVYKLEARPDGRFVSRVFSLPGDPLKYAGAWKQPQPLAELKPTDLAERTGCHIVLRRQADGSFVGSTEGRSCPSDLRAAKYATSEVTITADRLHSWDRGFDASGKQVWGAEKGPYQFRREKD